MAATMTMTASSTRATELSTGTSLACLRSSGSSPLHRPAAPASFLLPRGAASSSSPRAVSSSLPLTQQQQQQQQEEEEEDEHRQQLGNVFSFKSEPVKKSQKQLKKAQWSEGNAPGEYYGGPPLNIGIRILWGGHNAVDYIWTKNWPSVVEAPDVADDAAIIAAANAKEPDSGFLSLNRAIALDSMDVDVSEELMKLFQSYTSMPSRRSPKI